MFERHDLHAGRGSGRRSVELACELIARGSDAPLLSWGTDLSESGMFVECDLLPAGEELVVCFRPPVAWRLPELMLFAEVARAARGRRQGDSPRGLGLRFLDLAPSERRGLERWLTPRPLPARATRPIVAPPSPQPLFEPHPFASRIS